MSETESRERQVLLQEELYVADLRQRHVTAFRDGQANQQARQHDDALLPLKALKDRAQRASFVYRGYGRVLRDCLEKYEKHEQREKALEAAAQERQHWVAEFRLALGDWIAARTDKQSERQALLEVWERKLEFEVLQWAPPLVDGESLVEAVQRVEEEGTLSEKLFDVLHAESVRVGMEWNEACESAATQLRQRHQEMDRFLHDMDQSLYGRSRSGDLPALRALLREAEGGLLGRAERRSRFLCDMLGPMRVASVHVAASFGHVHVVEFLCKQAPECATLLDGAGWSAVYHAVTSRDPVETLQVLNKASNGAALRAVCNHVPLIAWAARCRSLSTVQLLLEEREALQLDVDACDSSGSNALCWSVKRGQLQIAKTLLLAGAAPDGREAVPLLEAILTTSCNPDVVECIVLLLHRHGAKPLTAAQRTKLPASLVASPGKKNLLNLLDALFGYDPETKST